MPTFSLRQILVGVAFVAAGLAVCRLPQGSWIDIPMSTLSCCFVWSLCRHAMAAGRQLSEHPGLGRQQLWGGRLQVVALLSTAMALVMAWMFRCLAAAELVLTTPSDEMANFVDLPTLPLELMVLAMLVAVGLESWQHWPSKATPRRQQFYQSIAVAGTLTIVLAYWANQLFVWFLVYLAIAGFEVAQSPRHMSQDDNVSNSVRVHRFVLTSAGGVLVVIANLLLVTALVKWWNRPRCRRILLLALAFGLTMESWLASWVGNHGIRQLSPSIYDAIHVGPPVAVVVAATLLILAVGAFSWRLLATPATENRSAQVPGRPVYFHENWLSSLLLGVVATTYMVNTAVNIAVVLFNPIVSTRGRLPPPRVDWEIVFYVLTHRPAQLLGLAAALGGFTVTWLRWRWKTEPVDDNIPCVNPAQFAVTMVSLLTIAVAGAPIIAAAGFSYWFVRFAIEQ